jgi:hypothetical protein
MVVAGLSLPIHLLDLLQPPDGSEGSAAIPAAAAYLDRQSAGSEGVRRRLAFEDQENQDKGKSGISGKGRIEGNGGGLACPPHMNC